MVSRWISALALLSLSWYPWRVNDSQMWSQKMETTARLMADVLICLKICYDLRSTKALSVEALRKHHRELQTRTLYLLRGFGHNMRSEEYYQSNIEKTLYDLNNRYKLIGDIEEHDAKTLLFGNIHGFNEWGVLVGERGEWSRFVECMPEIFERGREAGVQLRWLT